jgi:hypothetical protein
MDVSFESKTNFGKKVIAEMKISAVIATLIRKVSSRHQGNSKHNA